MNKKYELLETNVTGLDGKAMYQIRALRDFDDVKKGDYGGLVYGEHNLSQNGNAWIYEGSFAYDCVCITGNAKVKGFIILHDDVQIWGDALLEGSFMVNGYTSICGDAVINDKNDYLSINDIDTYISSITFWKSRTGIEVFVGRNRLMMLDQFVEYARKDSTPMEHRFIRSLIRYVEEMMGGNRNEESD